MRGADRGAVDRVRRLLRERGARAAAGPGRGRVASHLERGGARSLPVLPIGLGGCAARVPGAARAHQGGAQRDRDRARGGAAARDRGQPRRRGRRLLRAPHRPRPRRRARALGGPARRRRQGGALGRGAGAAHAGRVGGAVRHGDDRGARLRHPRHRLRARRRARGHPRRRQRLRVPHRRGGGRPRGRGAAPRSWRVRADCEARFSARAYVDAYERVYRETVEAAR